MTEQLLSLEIHPFGKRYKVLEIGTGSGYQAAVLAELAAFFTIERHMDCTCSRGSCWKN